MTERTSRRVVGLVPMAGKAARLGPLPCSKEILPVSITASATGPGRPKALAHHLLEHFVEAGITNAFLIVGVDKWDIARFLTRTPVVGLELAFLGVEDSPGTPFSLDRAESFVADAVCAMGFPDILLPERDPFGPLLARLESSGADVVLGLYRANDPGRCDVVDVDGAGRITELIPKPALPVALTLTWSVAVWRPTFTRFMHELLAPAWRSRDAMNALLAGTGRSELYLGDVVNHARRAGLRCEAIVLSERASLDAGTPASWAEAVRGGLGTGPQRA